MMATRTRKESSFAKSVTAKCNELLQTNTTNGAFLLWLLKETTEQP